MSFYSGLLVPLSPLLISVMDAVPCCVRNDPIVIHLDGFSKETVQVRMEWFNVQEWNECLTNPFPGVCPLHFHRRGSEPDPKPARGGGETEGEPEDESRARHASQGQGGED